MSDIPSDTDRIYTVSIMFYFDPYEENDRNSINSILDIISRVVDNYTDDENKLSQQDFNKLKKITTNFECSICMEYRHEGILLNCDHIFCESCIKEWLTKSKKNCPTCRKEVVI